MSLSAESEQHWSNLLRALRRSPGFSFHVLSVHRRVRDEVLRRLRKQLGHDGIPRLTWLSGGEDGFTQLQRWLDSRATSEPSRGLLIADGDALLSHAEGSLISTLNVARDLLGDILGGPLVLVVSPLGTARLPGLAPDLFQVRMGTYWMSGIEPGEDLLDLFSQAERISRIHAPQHTSKEIKVRRELFQTAAANLREQVPSKTATLEKFASAAIDAIQDLVPLLCHSSQERRLIDEVERATVQAIHRSSSTSHDHALSGLHLILNRIHRWRGQTKESLKEGGLAVEHAEKSGRKGMLAICTCALADTYLLLLRQPQEALEVVTSISSLESIGTEEKSVRVARVSGRMIRGCAEIYEGSFSRSLDSLVGIESDFDLIPLNLRAIYIVAATAALSSQARFDEASSLLCAMLPRWVQRLVPTASRKAEQELLALVDSALGLVL